MTNHKKRVSPSRAPFPLARVQVERLRGMVKRLQRDRQSKDADLAALKKPAPAPKEFSVELRVRGMMVVGGNSGEGEEEREGVWCLVRPVRPVAEVGQSVTAFLL